MQEYDGRLSNHISLSLCFVLKVDHKHTHTHTSICLRCEQTQGTVLKHYGKLIRE